MKLSIFALALAVVVLMAGCSKSQNPPAPTTATPTTNANGTTPSEPSDSQSKPLTVKHDHRGLHFNLDSTFSVGLDQADADTFMFHNDKITGSVRFGTLEELGCGADSSEAYALAMKEQHGAENAWVGSRIGIVKYVVITKDGQTQVQCLYLHDQSAWLAQAQSADASLTDQMIGLVACGNLIQSEIPVQ